MLRKVELQKKASKFKVGQSVAIGNKEGIIHSIHQDGNFICVQFKRYKECFYPEAISEK